jgi:predicted DsbA family dithiol-disulfide isomerase
MFDRIRQMGGEEGLEFDFDAIDIAPNTADAHRLVLWAQDQEEGDEVATALFRAYFSEGRNVSNQDVLVACADESGLDAEASRELLKGTEYADEVRVGQQQAQRRGITGVPCYVFNGEQAVMGAQPVDTLIEVMDAVAPEVAAGK